MMNKQRLELYAELEKRIGNTSLEMYEGFVPNNNRIWLKLECKNPGKSHYTRANLALIRHNEEKGLIKPGQNLLETTSGTNGGDFSFVATESGYKPYVVIPEGTDKSIIDWIIECGGTILEMTPEEEYVNGFPTFLKEFIPKHGKNYFFLNHSMGKRQGPGYTNNLITLKAFESIGHEILHQIYSFGTSLDYYVPGVGNGSSILGPGSVLHKQDVKVITFEPVQSAVVFGLLYGDETYIKTFGIDPGKLRKHLLRGLSYRGIDFPHIKNSINFIQEAVLVSDDTLDLEYFEITNGRTNLQRLQIWKIIDGRIEKNCHRKIKQVFNRT